MGNSCVDNYSGRRATLRPRASVVLAAVGLAVAGCANYPADPENSLETARGSQLQVGVTEHPPWVEIDDDDEPFGLEAELIIDYAERLDAEVAWTVGSESELMGLLDSHQLDVVIGGFDENTPWQSEAATTRPYGTASDGTARVLLVEMGENALLSDMERYLIDTEDERAGEMP